MALYLVTGGAGFIGSNIVQALLNQKHDVRVLDNFATGKRDNLAPFRDRIDLIEGDIRSYHLVRAAVEGVDYILHQAALPSVPRSIKDPITSNEVNVAGTLNLLEAAHHVGVKRLVIASSSSIYGDLETLPKTEDMLPKPLSPYAVSKLAAEKYCGVFTQLYGLETVALRYFNVFGPRQDPTSQYSAVIPKFVTAMLQGKSPMIYGDGEQSRDFTFVENVVHANLLACHPTPDTAGNVFNVATGKRISLNMLVDLLNEILGSDIEPQYLDPRPGDVKHSLANIGKAQQFLDYQVKVDFKTGLQHVVEWMKTQMV
ncbi:NAD-dependent epimerase/dehydratase family protein [candidate division KSB1 bacterium]|nr:NAD-dependent epimerase/dehydratase family protein [candidate division KSB1 bacterium]